MAVKRILDVLLSSVALIGLAPVMGIVALIIAATLGRPVIFAQRRPGRHESIFTVYKFRTMTDARGPGGGLRPDSERLTAVGRWIRRLSLDELPQLWNVLRGDMSLVGPRPLTIAYLPWYTPRERRRFEVLPGITGLAQVRGRNAVSWDDRLAYDAEYVENWSIWQDLRILAETVAVLLRPSGSGVVEDPTSVMLDLDVERRARAAGGAG